MKITDSVKIVQACAPATLTSTAGDGVFVDLRAVNQVAVLIDIKNGTSVTASNISLLQGNVTGHLGKTLSFNTYYKNEDTSAGDTLTKVTASNDSFLTLTTNSKNLQYVINVPLENLDSANAFCSFRVDVANMANAVGSVSYVLETIYQPLDTSVIA